MSQAKSLDSDVIHIALISQRIVITFIIILFLIPYLTDNMKTVHVFTKTSAIIKRYLLVTVHNVKEHKAANSFLSSKYCNTTDKAGVLDTHICF